MKDLTADHVSKDTKTIREIGRQANMSDTTIDQASAHYLGRLVSEQRLENLRS